MTRKASKPNDENTQIKILYIYMNVWLSIFGVEKYATCIIFLVLSDYQSIRDFDLNNICNKIDMNHPYN